MKSSASATCPLCEAICGINVDIEDNKITRIRGNPDDPFSRGYICPKGVALEDLQHDPDRLRKPLRRTPNGWTEISWDDALAEAGDKIGEIQERYGRDAAGLYVGNPTAHSYSAVLYGILLHQVLGSKRVFSANSVDALPRLLSPPRGEANRSGTASGEPGGLSVAADSADGGDRDAVFRCGRGGRHRWVLARARPNKR